MNCLPLLLVCLLLVASLACAQAPKALPVALTGDWQVTLGPGTVHLGGRDITLAQGVAITIPRQEAVAVKGESIANVPVYNPKGNWRKGVYFAAVRAQECSTTSILNEQSVVVKRDTGEALTRGTDYELDPFWGGIGRLEGGALPAGQKIVVDYEYVPERLDSVYVEAGSNTPKLALGKPGVGIILPPALPEGAVTILNVYQHAQPQKLTDEALYPVFELAPPAVEPVAERLLPKTLAKLRAGQEVRIIAWGDSVTCGGGVGGQTDLWYQNAFAKELGKRFPQAKINLTTAGWGGQNSAGYMAAPRGGDKDFVREVLEPKADLITIEFVNDSGLNGEALKAHYTKIMGLLHETGAEVILIAPHLVRPDWIGQTSAKFDVDPRPYVRDLKQFATDNQIALADGSARWCRLWRQGLPYMTMEGNSINHPDGRGHQLFVDALMALFPEK